MTGPLLVVHMMWAPGSDPPVCELRQSDHQEVTVPKSYSPSVRRQVCARLRSGEPVAEIAAETGISPATLFRWKAQALGYTPGTRRNRLGTHTIFLLINHKSTITNMLRHSW